MALVVSKGTILKQTIASVLTAVAQVKSITMSGAGSESYEARTLDVSGAGVPHKVNGWTEGGSVAFGLFYDPALAGHKAILTVMTTPASCVWNIVCADTGASVIAFTSSAVGHNITVDAATGLSADVTLKVDGLPTYPA